MENKICESALELANSLSYKVVLLIKTLICLLGVFSTLACIRIEGVKWLVHPNAKAIFSFHLFWAVYVPFFYTISMGFDLIRLSAVHSDPCSYTLSTTTSFSIRAIPVFGLVTQSYVMCAVSIERAVSTMCAKSYERIRKPYFGIFLAFLATGCSATIVFFLLYLPINWDTSQFVTTIRTQDNARYYQNTIQDHLIRDAKETVYAVQGYMILNTKSKIKIQLYLYMLVELFTIILFFVTYFINEMMYRSLKKNPHISALSNKYQIKENRQIITALLPCFIIHFLLNVVSTFGITVWQKIGGSYNEIDSAVCIEYLSHAQAYSVIMPSLIFYRLQKRRRRVVTDTHKSIDAHFEQLSNWFDKK